MPILPKPKSSSTENIFVAFSSEILMKKSMSSVNLGAPCAVREKPPTIRSSTLFETHNSINSRKSFFGSIGGIKRPPALQNCLESLHRKFRVFDQWRPYFFFKTSLSENAFHQRQFTLSRVLFQV